MNADEEFLSAFIRVHLRFHLPHCDARGLAYTRPAMLPTSTDVTITVKPKAPADADAEVVFITADAATAHGNGRAVQRLFDAGVVRGKAKEIAFDLVVSV